LADWGGSELIIRLQAGSIPAGRIIRLIQVTAHRPLAAGSLITEYLWHFNIGNTRSGTMGDPCCQAKACELSKLKKQQAKVLWAVMSINIVMFVTEFGAGVQADSLSLTGDSLDMLGDALVYASSLYVINKSVKAQAGAAFLKGLIMFLFAIGVFARACYQLFTGASPDAPIMSIVGAVALLANLLCLLLLTRHRNDNLNMSSVWICSRNDIIANISVLIASALVSLTHSILPDLAVGLLLTFMFAKSAGQVLAQSWRAIQHA
jgi:Co/Zn/Cd efflux system component